MSADSEDYGHGEVLTGAELYFYLLRQNEEQLERAQDKLREYTALRATLHALTEHSRRRVLAPVAGGLAYFPAELNATNAITVLLGDGWFAERSAAQAEEIAGRRIDFLRREAAVLRQEQAALRSKQELFLSEMPEAQQAVAQLLAEKDGLRRDDAAGQPSSLSSAAPAAAAAVDAAVTPVSGDAASTAPPTPPAAAEAGVIHAPAAVSRSAASPPADATAPPPALNDVDFAAVDAALATFDEQDELTEDELIALERELGDHLEDDEYVERVMTERMIEKKERRVRAELARRQQQQQEEAAAAADSVRTAVAAPSNATAAVAVEEKKGGDEDVQAAPPPPAVAFRTPGDIGGWTAPPAPTADVVPRDLPGATGEVVSAVAEPEAASTAASPAASTSSSPSRRERHVHFHKDVLQATETPSSSPAAASATPFSAAAQQSLQPMMGLGEHESGAISEAPPSLLRATYKIGDIVEHVDAAPSAAPPPPPLVFPSQRQKPKRKSLFMRDLEGDEA